MGVGIGGPGWKSKNSKEPPLPCTRDRPRAERPLEEDPELSPNCCGHSHPSPRSPLASQMPPPGPQTVDGMPARRWDPPRPSACVLSTECVCICRSTVFLLFCRREGPPHLTPPHLQCLCFCRSTVGPLCCRRRGGWDPTHLQCFCCSVEDNGGGCGSPQALLFYRLGPSVDDVWFSGGGGSPRRAGIPST